MLTMTSYWANMGARKFAEMGVETGNPIEAPEPLEKRPRMMTTTTRVV